MKTVLQYFKEKIDTCIENNQKIVRRKTMIEEYYKNDKNCAYYVSHPGQFDSIRRQLTVCGYLADGTESGFYTILKPIESDLNSGELRRKYDVMIKGNEFKQYLVNDVVEPVFPKEEWNAEPKFVFISMFKKLFSIFR